MCTRGLVTLVYSYFQSIRCKSDISINIQAVLCDTKTRISIGWPLTMDLYYKLIGHSKRVSGNLKEMVEKLTRIYPHLAEWGE